MKKIAILCVFGLFCVQIFAQPMKRRAAIHAQVNEMNDSLANVAHAKKGVGLYILSVEKGGTADRLKLQAKDVLLSINGQACNSKSELKKQMKSYREGDPIKASYLRNGKTTLANAKAAPMNFEKSDKFEVIYDTTAFGSGQLRVIVNKPKGPGKFPAILFIPGYMCYSLDNIGNHPYAQLVNQLCEQGFVVLRVEKLGEGDNVNTPDCRQIGLHQEVSGFVCGLRKLKSYSFTDLSNVFIVGHSLGAMQAPLVAAQEPVKGIAIEGTSGDNWFEYILAMFRYQNPISGADWVENEDMIKRITPVLYELLIQKKTPQEIALKPEYDSLMRDWLQYDGKNQIWDRHYSYWQELEDVNQAVAWKATDAHVLVMRGTGDLEAFSDEQHQAVVSMINSYHPNHAKFVSLPNSDHAFCKSNTPKESFENGQIPGYHYTQFNPEIIQVISRWIKNQ